VPWQHRKPVPQVQKLQGGNAAKAGNAALLL